MFKSSEQRWIIKYSIALTEPNLTDITITMKTVLTLQNVHLCSLVKYIKKTLNVQSSSEMLRHNLSNQIL